MHSGVSCAVGLIEKGSPAIKIDELLAGLDVGTTAVKAVLVTQDGVEVAHGRAPTEWTTTAEGVEADPQAIVADTKEAWAMPLVTAASLIDPAHRDGYGVAAFNVITLEHAEAIAAGAERAGQPAILQISENAVRHHRRLEPLAAAVIAVARTSVAPLAIHLDHVRETRLLHQAADNDIPSVMFDASKLDYLANVAATRQAAEWAHAHGIWLEAELGEIGGKGGAHAPGVRTDPDEAADYVAATNVDGLAVAVGSSHAMIDRTAALDISLIRELAERLPVPLVLHGSSGVPDETLAAAVRAGMVKINIGTILNVAFTRAVRQVLAGDDAMVDPRKYLGPARDAISDEVARLLTVIATASAAGSRDHA